MANITERINQEWIALNAFRGMIKIASKGSMTKSTYDNSLDLGGALYPELLGPEKSVLKRERESDTTKEYRQKAELQSIKQSKIIHALELVIEDIDEYESLIDIANKRKEDNKRTDQLKRKLKQLNFSKQELETKPHSEHQLIFRDAYNVDRDLPELTKGHGYRDFELPEGKILRLRVLHPDKPEHITGADIIYERHIQAINKASIVAVQYKIWEERKLYLSDPRLREQLAKMKLFTCEGGLCSHDTSQNTFRFPFCSAFLRPTDKLQGIDQKFISTGEHIPICRIENCISRGIRGAELLEYEKIKEISLSTELFEELFNRGKIGSRLLSMEELYNLYYNASVIDTSDSVLIYAQEF